MASSRFLQGAKVEVRSNEDGFRGGWFEATILKHTRKHRRYAISYDSLVTDDDPPKPVEETVYYNFVRPRPPPPPPHEGGAGTFKIHQAVEAYHNDAWWKGVVWKVPKRWRNGVYTVCFPSSRELLEFKAEEMREQLEWLEGAWAPVQDQEKGSRALVSMGKKSAGRKQKTCAVERDEVPHLLTSCDSNGEFAGEDDVILKVNKSEGHKAEGGVETSQPCKKLKIVELLEQLKWANETESGPRKRKQRSQAGKESNSPITVLTSSSNDDEVAEESVIIGFKDKNVQEPNFENVASSHQSCKKLKKGKSVKDNVLIVDGTLMDGAPKTPNTAEKASLSATTMSEGTLALLNEENHTIIYPSERVGTKSHSFPSLTICHDHDIAGANDNDELGQHYTRKRRKKLVMRGSYRKREGHHAVDMKELTQEEMKRRKRGNGLENIIEMERSSVNPTPMDDNLREHNKFTASALPSEKALTDHALSNTEKDVSVIKEAPSDPIPIAPSPPDKDIRDNDELIPSTSPTKKAIIGIHPAPTESLPIPKMSAMWRIVESMKAFRSIPQQPHFRELIQYLREFREGMAMGLMLTFANIVDDITQLRITDSRDFIERKLEALSALESNGFDVRVVRSHLEKLPLTFHPKDPS